MISIRILPVLCRKNNKNERQYCRMAGKSSHAFLRYLNNQNRHNDILFIVVRVIMAPYLRESVKNYKIWSMEQDLNDRDQRNKKYKQLK